MKRLALLLSLLLVVPIVSATDTDGDGFDDDVDHRDDEDAHIILSLNNWNANTSEEWDNDNGAPDPHFQVCIDADEERVDCFDSPKWTDTFQLGQVWNLTVNIPDDSSLLEFTIECRDDDIANDDECDMNNQSGEWKLVFIFAWLDNPSANYSGSGFGDDEVESRNAASNWTVFSPSTVEEVEEIHPEGKTYPRLGDDSEDFYDGDDLPDAPELEVGRSVDLDQLMRSRDGAFTGSFGRDEYEEYRQKMAEDFFKESDEAIASGDHEGMESQDPGHRVFHDVEDEARDLKRKIAEEMGVAISPEIYALSVNLTIESAR